MKQGTARVRAAVALSLGVGCLIIGLPESGRPIERSAHGAEPPSARSRLRELRKRREKRGASERNAAHAKQSSWATPDDVNYIDQLLNEEWQALEFPIADQCTAGEFIRRVSLDLIGRIPTLEETNAHLADRSDDKRAKLVDRLLASEEYGKNWANVWGRLLTPVGSGDRAGGANRNINPAAMRAWLQTQFNRNVPWNRMVHEILSATGRWDENGATNFVIAKYKNNRSTELTAFTTKLFLCVQTQCTECHDHPWNDWKQSQFHGIDAFFKGTAERRVTRTNDSGRVVTDYYEVVERPIESLAAAAFFERRNGLRVMVPPTYLDGRDIPALRRDANRVGDEEATDVLFEEDASAADEPVRLREVLADVITADDNPYFARAIVNRMWYHFLGHSFVKSVDDFDNGQDEPSMPELLDRLSSDFKRHGYDLKRLQRWICVSDAYALATRRKGKDADEAIGFFTFQLVKPLTPDQLYDSVMTLTRIHKAGSAQNAAEERRRFLREFERTFGTTQTPTTTPRYDGSVPQALMMMNSPLMTRACACEPGTFLHDLATDADMDPMEKIDAVFLAALSRKTMGTERKRLRQLLRTGGDLQDALSDVLWALLNSAEFVLNH